MNRSRLNRALLLCVREHDWRRAPTGLAELVDDPSTLEQLVRQSRRHGISSFVYLSVRHLSGTDPTTMAQLEADYLAGLATQLKISADLAAAASKLDECRVPFLVLKGPALAQLAYERPDLRPYTDLDLLVHGRDFGTAYQALETPGNHLSQLDWSRLVKLLPGELQTRLSGGSVCDLHWHLVNLRGLRESTSISTAELFGRAQPVNLKGTAARTLGREDQLLHSCVHAATSGAVRLRWLKDIERCAGLPGIDWSVVAERARKWGVDARVGATLHLAASTIGFGLPKGIVEALVPSPVGRAGDRLLARRWAGNSWNSALAPSVIWMRVRSGSPRETLGAGLSYLRRRSPAVNAKPGRVSTSLSGGKLGASGSSDARSQFFDLVAARDR